MSFSDFDRQPTSFKDLHAITGGNEGISWRDARILTVDLPLDRTAVKRILPWGLWPDTPARGTLFICDYPRFPYGRPYHEALLMVHVRSLLGRALHCVWILVDDDAALVAGREFLGYPKKMGSFAVTEDARGFRAAVSRRGVTLIDVTAVPGAVEPHPAPVFDRMTLHLGGPGQLVALAPLVIFRPRERITASCAAAATLRLGDSVLDPIAPLVAGDPLGARLVTMDITGSRYYFLAGISGGRRWCLNTFNLRFR